MWTRNSGSGASVYEAPLVALAAERSQPGESGVRAAAEPLPAAWFRDHVEAVWRLVSRLGVPAHSIDDVVQEVFITADRRRADIREGQVRSFLLSTAVRLSANHRQRAHLRREVPDAADFEHSPSGEPDAEQLLMNKRWRELLGAVLLGLSDAHRAVFVLFELEGFSAPEIAEMLELPLGTVSSRLQRARAHFSELAAELQRTLDPECP